MDINIKTKLLRVEYQSRVTTWCLGFPSNLGFTLCSNTHMTDPVNMKNAPIVHHMPGVKGSMNAQELFASSALTGTTITIPDSAYGCVKSTYLLRLDKIVISPTTPSNFCQPNLKSISTGVEFLLIMRRIRNLI